MKTICLKLATGGIFGQDKQASIKNQNSNFLNTQKNCALLLALFVAAFHTTDSGDFQFLQDSFKKVAAAVPNELEEVSDICKISNAMIKNPLAFKSYWPDQSPAVVPHPSIPHISSELCQLENNHSSIIQAKKASLLQQQAQTEEAGSIMCFKAARTGSSFFASVITKTMMDANRTAYKKWEPFGAPQCNGNVGNATKQAISLRDSLRQKCKGRKCNPSASCEPVVSPIHQHSNPVFITALNPRFLNPNLDWNQVFEGIQNPRIFTLRRTNLVLMAYSKFHHFHLKGKNKFDLDLLVSCAHDYALGDQELSTSVAFAASKAAGESPPHLIVYEDVLSNGRLVQNGVLEYLGVTMNTTNIFEENAKTKIRHVKAFCDNVDIDCKELKSGLEELYPCLFKQLEACDEGYTWSVPMFPNGTISLFGDCVSLQPLNEGHPVRRIDEVYVLPST